ncbi:MAG: Na+/H+ antiporter NhaA [Bacteroidota bacterium]
MSETKKVVLAGYRDLKRKVSSESSSSLRTALAELGDTISFGYKYCPDLEKHPSAQLAAQAIVAAESQGKSEAIYQEISGKEEYSQSYVFAVAQRHGVDIDQFTKDFHSESVLQRVKNDIADAKASGLTVFPGLTIDGIPYNGAWDDYSLFDAIEKRGGKHITLAIESFFEWGASAAAVLIIATFGALLMVNVGFHEVYEHWKHTDLGVMFGSSGLILALEVWINDFLMAIFFLLIGIEIKKEILDGELSDMKRAAMPVVGALGGMFIPAGIYALINIGAETSNGWGIPMATDIAFTLGLMALLGRRVPLALKVFISALAVADDLGAIVVIALFYGHGFHLIPFIGAIVVIGVMFFLNRRKVFSIEVYMGLGLLLWFFIFQSGLHATLAGVITAILIPTRDSANLTKIAEQTSIIFDRAIAKVNDPSTPQKTISHSSLQILQNAVERLRDPSDTLMHGLERVVNFFILPLFAFFNTGILLSGMQLDLVAPGNLGILLGLAIGKPLGIVGACWMASKLKVAQLSSDITWPLLLGGAALAGVGFTMSIVVAASAFSGELLAASKVSILIASTVSAIAGLVILRSVTKPQ